MESNRYASPVSRLIIYGLPPPWPGLKLTEELGELQHRKTRAVTTIFMTIISARSRPLDRGGGGGPKNVFSGPSWFRPQFGPKVTVYLWYLFVSYYSWQPMKYFYTDLERPYPKCNWKGCYGFRYWFPVLSKTYRYPILHCIKRWQNTIYKKPVTLIFQRQIFSMLSLLSRGIIPMLARLCCMVTLEPNKSMFSVATYARLYMT